jgi:hypothetical protein
LGGQQPFLGMLSAGATLAETTWIFRTFQLGLGILAFVWTIEAF